MKYALLILNMQKFYNYNRINISLKNSINSACEYINMALDLFRKKNLPIIWIQWKAYDKGGIFKEEPAMDAFDIEIIVDIIEITDIKDILKPHKLDKIMTKEGVSGFKNSGLLEYIKENEIDTLIITGLIPNIDVKYTYMDAENYDLKPIILKNGLVECNIGEIANIEKISKIITINELEKLIG